MNISPTYQSKTPCEGQARVLEPLTSSAFIRVHPRLNLFGLLKGTADERRWDELTEKIIGRAYEVSNGLGAGFLEKVYENAMRIELQRAGLAVLQQHPIPVTWRGEVVGDYLADLLVENTVIVELKSVKTLDKIHLA